MSRQSVLLCIAALSIAVVFVSARGGDNCYINDSGFTCCDKALESAMRAHMDGSDLLGAADNIQKGAQRRLGGKFETVVAEDDFAYKSHFKDGKTCKIEKNGRYALAWQP